MRHARKKCGADHPDFPNIVCTVKHGITPEGKTPAKPIHAAYVFFQGIGQFRFLCWGDKQQDLFARQVLASLSPFHQWLDSQKRAFSANGN